MEVLPLAAAAMMGNVDVSAQVVLSLTSDFQKTTHQYQCEGIEQPLTVAIINADPNYFAIVPVGPQKLLFVNVISADGAKYVAGQYEFWTKGADATLTDLQADPQSVECSEINETP